MRRSGRPRRRIDAQGRAYLPVYDDAEPSFTPHAGQCRKAAQGERKILFYRNPMGLPDTSPVPKKDSMGMDYIPVYEGDEHDDGKTIKVSLDQVQRSGVRTEPVETRVLVQPGARGRHRRNRRAPADHRDVAVGRLYRRSFRQYDRPVVRAGEPLFRVFSPEIQQAQIDLLVAAGRATRRPRQQTGASSLDGAMQRLRNLGVPESRIREVRESGINPRTIDWPAPASGTVLGKRIINGQTRHRPATNSIGSPTSRMSG